MGPRRTGSLESLRERNRLRVIDALRAAGRSAAPRSRAGPGLSRRRSPASSAICRPRAGRRARDRRRRGPGPQGGRPPILLALDARPAPPSASTSATTTCASPSPTSRTPSSPSRSPSSRSTTAAEEPRPRRRARRGAARRGRRRARPRARGRHGPARADRPRHRLVRPTAILPGWLGLDAGRRDGARGSACPSSSRTTPTSARSARRRFGAGRGARRPGLPPASRPASAPASSSAAARTTARRHGGRDRPRPGRPHGPICRCGNRGCLETFVAGPALCELLRRTHGPLTVRQLLQLAQEGDAGCQRVIADAGRVVGRAVADLCNYLNPELVVVGGELAPPATCCSTRCARPSALRDPGRGRGRRDPRRHARRPRRGARRAGPRRPESEDPLTVPVPHMSHPTGGGRR